jgi:hypothetical protein
MKTLKTTVAALALLAGAAGQPALANSMFDQGLQDRTALEQWFNSLQGDYKTGAFYWTSQRSIPHPGSCQQMNADFYRGCTDAKVKFAPTDALRKTEPAYKVGWNSYAANVGPIAAPEMTSTPAPAPQVSPAPAPQVTINVGPSAPTHVARPQPEPAAQPEVPAAAPAPAPTSSSHKGRWYIGHLGQETCVPVDDISFDAPGGRLYYGTGSMHTPDDFVRWVANHGTSLRRESGLPDGFTVYVGRIPGHAADTAFAFFQDKALCGEAMAMMDK